MDKKQKITWGVSFGSLALAAGMVSYLGLSHSGSTNSQMAFNQGQQPSSNTNQNQQQGGLNTQQDSQQDQQTGQDFNSSWGGDSQLDQSQQTPDDNSGQGFDSSNQQQGQFFNGSGPGSGHHHGFDTTTGGT
ncbi:hypothetical protein [Neobacillus vireti]|uniref:hypothetical protein n=1 Tax=Neobacillus vireti TaxID=220686 RepID=UPI00300053D3